MGDPAALPATYEDVLVAPPHVVAELIDGELPTQPRPAIRHMNVGLVVGAMRRSVVAVERPRLA